MSEAIASAWERLANHPGKTLEELFRDENRVEKLSARIDLPQGGIVFDWSKTHLDDGLIAGFEALSQAAGFAEMRAKLLAGEIVNPTEGRPAEHTAQRGVGDEASVEEAAALHLRMKLLVEAIHQGALGEVRHLIHIGIGGSALGPALDELVGGALISEEYDGTELIQATVILPPRATAFQSSFAGLGLS